MSGELTVLVLYLRPLLPQVMFSLGFFETCLPGADFHRVSKGVDEACILTVGNVVFG